MLTTDQKGAIAEAEITAAAIQLGVGVYKPVMEGGRFDLVLEMGSRPHRVQCKFARLHGEVVRVCCYSTRRAREGLRKRVYRVAEVDLIAVYCLDLDRCFLLSGDEFDGRTQIDLRVEPCRNNQRTGVNRAADFDFAARLPALMGP
jgi:PD-(D/E)XK nuclease superfamily protein